MGVDRGNTTQAVFSDIINLAGVDYKSGELKFSHLYSTEQRLSAVEAKIIFIGPPPVPPIPRSSQKWAGHCPPHPGCAAHDLTRIRRTTA